MDALDRMKITENTLVIFSSDNGPARGAPNSPITLMYDSATGPGFGIGELKGLLVVVEHLKEPFLRAELEFHLLPAGPARFRPEKLTKNRYSRPSIFCLLFVSLQVSNSLLHTNQTE